jgi:hypothetical protein
MLPFIFPFTSSMSHLIQPTRFSIYHTLHLILSPTSKGRPQAWRFDLMSNIIGHNLPHLTSLYHITSTADKVLLVVAAQELRKVVMSSMSEICVLPQDSNFFYKYI